MHRDERTGRVIVFGAIDNLWKGRRSAGGPEPEPDVRAATRGRGSVERFFNSRWIEVPEQRRPSLAGRRPAAGFPRRRRRLRDQAHGAQGPRRCCSATAPQTTSAARFTSSGAQSAPVLLTRQRTGSMRCGRSSSTPATPTPRPAAAGSTTPPRCRAGRRRSAGSSADQVAVASTGVIGVPLPMGRSPRDARRRARAARRRGSRLRRGDPHDRPVRKRVCARRHAPRRAPSA